MKPVSHRALVGAIAAAAIAGGATTAAAAPVTALPTTPQPRLTALAPGITYERAVRDGGQVVHIVRARSAPRIGLRPVLAGGAPSARGRLGDAIARIRDTRGAVAGVNGDFFNFSTGNPSGVVMVDGALVKEPEPSRSALLIRDDGAVDAAALQLEGRWRAFDVTGARRFPRRTFQGLNRSAYRDAEAVLYTTAYGRVATPEGPSRFEARVRLDEGGAVVPGRELSGVVVDTGPGGGMTIGRGHAVLTGVGASGRTMARDLEPGRRITITPGLATVADGAPLSPEVVAAVGGGPLLVRDGEPVLAAGEGFSSAQTGARTARTAIGQSAAGTLLLVTAEGFIQGSPGVTVAEQARLMADLGSRVAVAMDAGGSAQMALGDRQVVPWGPAPRRLATAVAVTFRGLALDELPARISPNADRVDDAALITVRTPVAGRVSVGVVHRSGRPSRALWSSTLGPSSARIVLDPRRLRLRDGIYLVVARMRQDDGSTMEQRRRVIVDRTLAALTARPSGRGARQRLTVRFRLLRPARVDAVVRDDDGRVVARLVRNRPMRPGLNRLVWNRRVDGRPAVGRHRVEVVARSAFGRTGLAREVPLARD